MSRRSVVEVKAVQAKGGEYALDGDVVTGPAVNQMLSTRRLLVFSANRDDELITIPARREILREHLYRELTKGTLASASSGPTGSSGCSTARSQATCAATSVAVAEVEVPVIGA